MDLRIVLSETNGQQTVLRGSPIRVSNYLESVSDTDAEIKTLCSLDGKVSSKEEEDELWLKFIIMVDELGHGTIALKIYEVWQRKAFAIWFYFVDPSYLLISTVNKDDMILSIESHEAPYRSIGNPGNN